MRTLTTIARGAYLARRLASRKRADCTTLQQALDEGLKLYKWDGKSPNPLVDALHYVCGTLGGIPGAVDEWADNLKKADSAMSAAAEALNFKTSDRRGSFGTMAYGTSYGGGQKRPGLLCHSKHNLSILQHLMADRSIQRIVSFQSSVFAFYAPKLYRDYATNMDALHQKYPELKYNWRTSVFPAVSFNFGPRAVTVEHRDHGNRAVGWCAITAGGNYDPRLGGHLILRELGIVIEFPPGATICIPSACLTHGNVPIRDGETRWSITQYAAGGLFRFVDYGFRTWAQLKQAGNGLADKVLEERDGRWLKELELLSKIEELHADRENAGLLK
ncbi:hypothetical protein PsYK624_058330 [Phanerochaete sordida]|uniref:Uncharacterized protein n=1 Tax=Phanerochaete sordida TaxID=48140 RepID=A0A9P3LDA7_9APHY|nr:hypothetical protein PsYK624_058330 [Phanerochaete sordida]